MLKPVLESLLTVKGAVRGAPRGKAAEDCGNSGGDPNQNIPSDLS